MKKRDINALWCAFLFLISIFGLAPALRETETSDSTELVAPAAIAVKGLKDVTEMEKFFDARMPKLMEEHHVPGASVSVVKDGKLFFAKGYGYADIGTGRAVLADTTLFRIASISKLFTWTAVMQQVEEGKIDLDADVNRYLKKLKIPDTYPGHPVTMRHLMTHTAGFDDHIEPRLYSKDPSDLEVLEDFLIRTWPPRVRPPGEIAVYSNYGTCLAALIVEEVSGMPFAEYIKKRITGPLDMNRTTIAQPLPDRLIPDMAVGYVYAKDRYIPQEFELIRLAPAGAISTTVTDMANFMIALLQLGRYGNEQVLEEAAARQMQTPQFSPAPEVSALCLGIYETNLQGMRMVGHAGDTVFFHSNLLVIPEHQVGLFVTSNSPGGSSLRGDLRAAFLDRYYPVQADEPKPSKEETRQRIAGLKGTYESMIYNTTTIEKYFFPLLQITIKTTPNGTLVASFRQNTSEIEEIKPYTFRSVSGVQEFHGDLVFVRNPEGQVTHYYLANAPFLPFRRIPFHATTVFANAVKIVCLLIFLSVLIWPVGAVIGTRKGSGKRRIPSLRGATRWMTASAALLMLAFVVLLSVLMSRTTLVERFFTSISVPLPLIWVLVLPVIAAVLTLCVIPLTVVAWLKKYWALWERTHYTLVVVALIAFMWWLNFYNLLGWRF